MVSNIRNNTISEINAKKGLNTLNKIKNAKVTKCKKHTPWYKKLLNLFNDLLVIILTEKTLESESQQDKNENEKVESREVESRKGENEKVESRKVENRKEENEKVESRKEENGKAESRKGENEEHENKNMLLKYIDVDDKLFKKDSNSKNFNSFINEFDHATNKEKKEKIVKELKDTNSLVNHYVQWKDDYSEYNNKLFAIINAVDYFLYEYSKKWASDF